MKQNVMINVILHFCPLGRSIKEWQDKVTAEYQTGSKVFGIKTMQVDLLRSGALVLLTDSSTRCELTNFAGTIMLSLFQHPLTASKASGI